MMKFEFVSLAVLSLVAGMAGSGKAHATEWVKALDCDGGAAVVDVDREQPSHVQLVVRDRGIVDYFVRSGASEAPGIPYNGKEIIVAGDVGYPVYSGQVFRGLTTSRQDGYAFREYWHVRREGAGVKLQVESSHIGCPDYCRENPYSMQCESLCVGAGIGETRIRADWLFRDCR